MNRRYSRRTVLAGGASAVLAGLAGCLSQDDDGQDDTVDTYPGDSGSAPSDLDSAQVPFRDWLVNPELAPGVGDNEDRVYRFEYVPGDFLTEIAQGRASVLDIDPAVVEGQLLQIPAVIYFGEFDQSALETAIESADGYTLTGDHESYRTARNTEAGTRFALGEEAVLIGRELELWIDTRIGANARLEETTSVFTQLFDQVPTDLNVSGQFGPPPTFEADLDSINAWISASAKPTADGSVAQTWIYAFDGQPSEDTTQSIQQELSSGPLVDSITETATDGQFLTVNGELVSPDLDS